MTGTPALDRTRPGREASVLGLLARLPDYARLLWGMMRDSRVSLLDRAFVVGALAYLVTPIDLLPDVIPLLGQVDDLFLVVAAVGRLFDRASREVVLSHWGGAAEELDPAVLRKLIYLASLVAPPGRRRRLRQLIGRAPAA